MLKLLLSIWCLLGVGSVPLSAGDTPFPFNGNDTFEGKVPSPGQWSGIPLGDRFTPHHDVVAYCRQVAALSPRVLIQEYGRSVEGRELVLVMISTESNIARARTTSARATSWGVETITAPVTLSACAKVSWTSPVPGGRSTTR